MSKFQSLWEDFSNALERFKEILKEPETDIVRDSAIKRFELVFDLSWKTLKAFLEEYHNTPCVSPRNCMREAFRIGVIDYDNFWIDLTRLRNKTVHTYNEALSKKIYRELPKTQEFFGKLHKTIEREIKS